jgi:hypothetical protein
MTGTSQTSKHLLIFSILSALFVFSQFYRVSSEVIAPNLIQDLGLNAEMLGLLGGAFLLCLHPAPDTHGPNVTSPN